MVENKNKDIKPKKKEQVDAEVVAAPVEPNTIPLESFNWKKIAVLSLSTLGIVLLFLYFLMFTNYEDKLTKYLGAAAIMGIMMLGVMFKVVSSSVGWDFVRKIMAVKKNKGKGYLLLKIHTVSGRPNYEIAKGGKWITYQFDENGNNISKRAFYDPLATYNDYSADVPMLEVTPDDIFPLNRFTATRITTCPELVEKTIIDSSKSADELDRVKKYMKYMIIALGIMAGGLFFGFDLYRQAIAESNQAVIQATKMCAQSATIVAGPVIVKAKGKLGL